VLVVRLVLGPELLLDLLSLKELTEESDRFCFLTVHDNFKGSMGLILTKDSVVRITIPLDLTLPLVLFPHSSKWLHMMCVPFIKLHSVS
jgi:hypothetical protein